MDGTPVPSVIQQRHPKGRRVRRVVCVAGGQGEKVLSSGTARGLQGLCSGVFPRELSPDGRDTAAAWGTQAKC